MRLAFSKWDGTSHWHFDIDDLGQDGFGRWFLVPAGRVLSKGDKEMWPTAGFVLLVPTTGWWLAAFNHPNDRVEVYVDVATEAQLDGHTWRTVDLDLDVVRLRTGVTYLDDEDEFIEHQVRYGYPQPVIETARRTADDLLSMVEQRIEPFGDVGAAWTAAGLGEERPSRPGR